jgi:hypothetical protein
MRILKLFPSNLFPSNLKPARLVEDYSKDTGQTMYAG